MRDGDRRWSEGAVMARDHVAFLRGISNVPMQPFRAALEGLGLTSVESFGASGNLLFRAGDLDEARLEAMIERAVGAEAFVRSRTELAAIVEGDPYAGREGAGVLLARRPIDEAHAESLRRGGFDGPAPVIVGATVYFVFPLRRPGRKSGVDLERELDVRGTMRGSRVLARVLERM